MGMNVMSAPTEPYAEAGAKPGSPSSAGAEVDGCRWAIDIRLVAESGDRAAFARLFEYYAPRIKGFLIRRGLPDGRAEELAQETMLSVWRKAARFDPRRAGASTWIFAIARHRAVDARRRAHAGDEDNGEGAIELEGLPDDAPGPEVRLDGERRDRAVRAALASLPVEQKTIVELSFFSELAHPAIAKRLDVPLGTVKSRMRLAMEKIRKSLEEYAP